MLTRSRFVLLISLAGIGCGKSTPPTPSQIFVYWDTNEEVDVLLPNGTTAKLVPPYDPNGQMCILRDGSGRFTTGYNPTLPNQHNPGSMKPYKNPPVGESLWNKDGSFDKTVSVPGKYALPGSSLGGDIPPDLSSTFCTDGVTITSSCTQSNCPHGCAGTFNNNASFTGCAIDSKGNLFAADIGQSQGQTSSPDQGRVIEWFAPDFTTFCIIAGPTKDGDGPHHVNGTGGLHNPGTFTVDPSDNLYVPETGAGRVIKFDQATLPKSAADCGPDGILSPWAPHTTFVQSGIPGGIAWDPTCNCFAVSNILASPRNEPLVSWFDMTGQSVDAKTPIPTAKLSPFGIAVAPSGDVYFADIGLKCDVGGCDTVDGEGAIYKVTMTGGQPSAPAKIAGGLYFPIGVTVCDTAKQTCPQPAP
jgi:hypothetical protein